MEDEQEITLEEFEQLPKQPIHFVCVCGRELPIRETITCPCGLTWKRHKGYMAAKIPHGTLQVPLSKKS